MATYAGWPLHTYLPDSKSGEASGQVLDANGGYWYVLSPSGMVVHTKPSRAVRGHDASARVRRGGR